jgi:hypothetical protein
MAPGGRGAVAVVAGRAPRPQARPAPPRTADRVPVQQRLERDLLVPLAAGQRRRDRPALAFGAQVQLGREFAAAAAQRLPGLRLTPPTAPSWRAPAACWWARMTLASTKCRSQSTSPRASSSACSAERTRSHTPDTRPAVEAARHRAHRAVAPRQIVPQRAGAQDPKDAVQDAPVVLTRPPRPGLLGWQVRFEAPPLRLRQIISSRPHHVGAHTRNSSGLQKRPRRRSVRNRFIAATRAVRPPQPVPGMPAPGAMRGRVAASGAGRRVTSVLRRRCGGRAAPGIEQGECDGDQRRPMNRPTNTPRIVRLISHGTSRPSGARHKTNYCPGIRVRYRRRGPWAANWLLGSGAARRRHRTRFVGNR